MSQAPIAAENVFMTREWVTFANPEIVATLDFSEEPDLTPTPTPTPQPSSVPAEADIVDPWTAVHYEDDMEDLEEISLWTDLSDPDAPTHTVRTGRDLGLNHTFTDYQIA